MLPFNFKSLCSLKTDNNEGVSFSVSMLNTSSIVNDNCSAIFFRLSLFNESGLSIPVCNVAYGMPVILLSSLMLMLFSVK